MIKILLEQLRNYDALTLNEKKVLAYILSHLNEIPLMTASEVALENFISKTVVVNLSHKLGYSGFKELKFDVANSLKEKNIQKSGPQDIKQSIRDKIEKTFTLLNQKMIEDSADIMARSNNIFIMARGTSLAAGYYMQHLLFSVNHHCIFINDYNLAEAFANLAGKNDCIIFISLSGETPKITETAKKFQLKESELITITGFQNNTLARMTPHNLYAYSEGNYDKNLKIDSNSRLGFFLVVESLVESFKDRRLKN